MASHPYVGIERLTVLRILHVGFVCYYGWSLATLPILQGLFFLTKVMPVNEEPGNPMRVFFKDQELGEWRRLTEIAHKVH